MLGAIVISGEKISTLKKVNTSVLKFSLNLKILFLIQELVEGKTEVTLFVLFFFLYLSSFQYGSFFPPKVFFLIYF